MSDKRVENYINIGKDSRDYFSILEWGVFDAFDDYLTDVLKVEFWFEKHSEYDGHCEWRIFLEQPLSMDEMRSVIRDFIELEEKLWDEAKGDEPKGLNSNGT